MIYKRVEDDDIYEIQLSFLECFNFELSDKYYKWKYHQNGQWNSFIVIDNGKIVSHVAYNYRSSIINNKKYLCASRHSSFTLKDYRGSNLYTNLLEYSKKLLINDGIFFIQAWPNQNNLRASLKHKDFLPIGQIATLTKVYEGEELDVKELICEPLDTKIIDELFNEFESNANGRAFSLHKTEQYLRNRYATYPLKQYYYFSCENGRLIWGVNKLFGETFITIMELYPKKGSCIKLLNDFMDTFSGFSVQIQVWKNIFIKDDYLSVVRAGFIPKEPIFTVGLYILDKELSQNKHEIFQSLTEYDYSLGDTDVF